MNTAFRIALAASLAIAAPGRSAEPAPVAIGQDDGAMYAQAERLVPSEASGDDCSADAGIDVTPDQAMRHLHVRLCQAAVEPTYRARCGKQAEELRSIRFVTDHCAGTDGQVEVSLGGLPFQVQRVGAATGTDTDTPSLAGVFEGDGLRMDVRPGRMIREHLDEGERIGRTQEVFVTLKLHGSTRTLPGLYSDGP